MNIAIKSVKALENYQLDVVFDNNERGLLDMNPYLDFGVFQRIKEVAIFNTVKVSFDTIEWDGNIDLDPDFVYRHTNKN